MKPVFIFLLTCLFWPLASFGQSCDGRQSQEIPIESYSIFMDSCRRGSDSRLPKLPHGRLVRLEVCCVNPFAYDLNVEANVYKQPIELPELFSSTLLKVEVKEAVDGVTDAQFQILESYNDDGEPDPAKAAMELVENQVKVCNEKLQAIQDQAELLNRILGILQDPSLNEDAMKGKLEEILASPVTFTLAEPHKLHAAAERAANGVEEAYEEFKRALDAAILAIDDRAAKERLLSTGKSMESVIQAFRAAEFTAKAKTVVAMLSYLNNKGFCRPVALVQTNGDRLDVTITKNPKEGIEQADLSETVKCTLEIKGGLRFSFSPMPFLVGIREATYHVSNLGGGSVYSIQELDIEHARIGVANMLNVTWRSGGWATGGLSIGVGLDGDGDLNYLLGLGGLFGKEQRVSVHAGLALREINTLPFSNQVGQVVSGPTFQIPDATEIGFGFFTGIGIALGGDKED